MQNEKISEANKKETKMAKKREAKMWPKRGEKNTKRKYKQILFEMWKKYKKRKYKQILLFAPPQFRPQSAFPSSIINSHFEESRIV